MITWQELLKAIDFYIGISLAVWMEQKSADRGLRKSHAERQREITKSEYSLKQRGRELFSLVYNAVQGFTYFLYSEASVVCL